MELIGAVLVLVFVISSMVILAIDWYPGSIDIIKLLKITLRTDSKKSLKVWSIMFDIFIYFFATIGVISLSLYIAMITAYFMYRKKRGIDWTHFFLVYSLY